MSWSPGQGAAARALEAPFENVPEHLWTPLWEWIQGGFNSKVHEIGSRLADLAIHLRVAGFKGRVDNLRQWCWGRADRMLKVVEAMLELWGDDDGGGEELRGLLAKVNSAYTVKSDCSGLEWVIDPAVKAAVETAVKDGVGSAGDHLANAWNAAYGIKHNAPDSYGESIMAVECALAPLVSPQNAVQTLGTMIRDIAAKPSKWTFVIDAGQTDSVLVVLDMMRVLWNGQTSRHGGTTPTRHETLEEARAAVHLAATLVQWGSSGAFAVV